ncbi:branched-chain amino acid ABC transporter permease [Malaciobacter mytili]|uniref:Branched-chain amino acid ABC transporter permease n=1 Tax=Malaciobacter mytili LMG 24559 TaxID=1032238 RepID=A0AAX2AKG6_9BACT|nr:branched-chain amino acid ABC transporter permease [Malaciobacter mytili]AXH14826.1 high-affinity branched-chain amino acid ABC transporter, permease protein [Malaciobacter mytili LMG 24559]RXI48075.1 branched-chain amino acid ABC transporter permease [Malaciobacter mytili]RXK16804.1 branched-chain amino acid ABC transporter permease [Malaciobacter mytili LMG 24559]
MDFITFFQQLINGISLGSMYALIAIGYTMVYGVLRLINFAHADIMMVGAFAAFFAMDSIGFSLAFAVLFAIIISVLTGIATDRIAYKPLRQAPRISLLITAIGVSFFLENIVNVTFGGTPKSFQAPDFFEQIIKIGGTTLTPTVIIVPLITMLLLAVLLYILFKTKYGIAIRALAFDIKTVSLMGVDSNKIIMIVFIIGSALAAVSGIFWAISYPILTPYMGVMIGLKAFAAAVLGGIGSVSGAVLGGFILGFTEVVFVAILPEYGGYKDAIAFIFLILVLLFKPTGIMGINFEKSRF